jgi:hypothetical protein
MKKDLQKLLQNLEIEHFEKKYPNFPVKYSPARSYDDNTANGLTKCIIAFLNFNGWQAERVSNMGRPVDQRRTVKDVLGRERQIGSMKWIPGSGTKGTADISATIKGRSVKIEVKIGADRQSEAQKAYQANVEMAGGVYVIARSFDEFMEWYEQFKNTTIC